MELKHDFDEAIDRRGTGCKKYSQYPPDVFPMWIADTDFKAPAPVVEALVKRMQDGVYGYPATSKRLWRAVQKWEAERFGWQIPETAVEFSPGVVPGVICAVRAFTKPGDQILIQTPCYPPFVDLTKHNRRVVVRNPLKLAGKRYEIDFEDLEKKLTDPKTTLMILCNPQNPSGRVYTREELERIGRLCLDNHVMVVSDEIHGDLTYSGHRHIPFASICPEFAEHCITFVNPSKTFNLAGFRTAAFIALNPEVKTAVHEELVNSKIFGENIGGVEALCVAYESCGYYADQMMEYVEANRKLVLERLEEIPGISCVENEGTYLLFLDCRELGMTQEKLDRFLVEKAKLGLNSGVSFGPEGEGFVRMNIACPRAAVAKAMDQLAAAVKTL